MALCKVHTKVGKCPWKLTKLSWKITGLTKAGLPSGGQGRELHLASMVPYMTSFGQAHPGDIDRMD